MTINAQRFIFGWSIILFWAFVAVHAFAADLAPPRRQSLTIVPLPRLPNPAVIPAPMSRGSESCLTNGVEPIPGQTLQADTTCPTGLRWKYQK